MFLLKIDNGVGTQQMLEQSSDIANPKQTLNKKQSDQTNEDKDLINIFDTYQFDQQLQTQNKNIKKIVSPVRQEQYRYEQPVINGIAEADWLVKQAQRSLRLKQLNHRLQKKHRKQSLQQLKNEKSVQNLVIKKEINIPDRITQAIIRESVDEQKEITQQIEQANGNEIKQSQKKRIIKRDIKIQQNKQLNEYFYQKQYDANSQQDCQNSILCFESMIKAKKKKSQDILFNIETTAQSQVPDKDLTKKEAGVTNSPIERKEVGQEQYEEVSESSQSCSSRKVWFPSDKLVRYHYVQSYKKWNFKQYTFVCQNLSYFDADEDFEGFEDEFEENQFDSQDIFTNVLYQDKACSPVNQDQS